MYLCTRIRRKVNGKHVFGSRDLAQLVAHTSGGREVAGSSPVIPTESERIVRFARFFCHFESSPVISTKRSAWRNLMRPLDYARGDIGFRQGTVTSFVTEFNLRRYKY